MGDLTPLLPCLEKDAGPGDYAAEAKRLVQVQELEKGGHLDIFYGDESGFYLTSAIPYGW